MTENFKPKVLIIIATSIVGGPGKGLFQFLRFAPAEQFDYLLCNFSVKGKDEGDFVQEAKRLGLNLLLLKQSHFYDLTLISQTEKLIQERGFNIIQTHGHKANFIARFVKRSSQIPWLCFVHGWTDEDLKIRIYNRIDRWAIKGADRIVAVSEAMKDKLVKIGIPEQKITVIYNAIEDNGFYKEPPDLDLRKKFTYDDDTLLVGVIGRLSKEKRVKGFFLMPGRRYANIIPKAKCFSLEMGLIEKFWRKFAFPKGLQKKGLISWPSNKSSSFLSDS